MRSPSRYARSELDLLQPPATRRRSVRIPPRPRAAQPLWVMPLQQFVYRQLMYLVIIESTISALIGVRARWQTIPRTGDVKVGGLRPSDSP